MADRTLRAIPRGDSSPTLFDPPPQVEAVRRIPLRGKAGAGLYALIDEADYPLVKDYKLYAVVNRRGRIYVGASKNGRLTLLHRLIMGAPKGVQVDHISGDRLDCRRGNLRLATQGQNLRNSLSRRGTSVYKGVHRSRSRWVASLRLDGRPVRLGSFESEEEAARAYDAAVREHFPVFGRVNFPRPGEQSAVASASSRATPRPVHGRDGEARPPSLPSSSPLGKAAAAGGHNSSPH